MTEEYVNQVSGPSYQIFIVQPNLSQAGQWLLFCCIVRVRSASLQILQESDINNVPL